MIEFNEDEIKTIKSIIQEWGCDCPGTDYEKVQELRYKLGLEKRPTAEEIIEIERKREEFAKSEFGQTMAKLMASCSHNLKQVSENVFKDTEFFKGMQWTGTELRIKLPKDYTIEKE